MKTVFQQLKVGQTVEDSWYGPGIVVGLSARRAEINLTREGYWTYDIQHVNQFVKILKKDNLKDNCAHCKGEVPRVYRRNARGGKAKKDAKTFYHYACVHWKTRTNEP